MLKNNVNLKNSKYNYSNEKLCIQPSINAFNIEGLMNYYTIIKYKNYSNITKNQLYSLYINTQNNYINNSRLSISNKLNPSIKKLITIQNNINNNGEVLYKDSIPPTRDSLDCSLRLTSDIRAILTEQNYKWFINSNQIIPGTKKTIKDQYPHLFNNGSLNPENLKLLNQFVNKFNFKNMSNKKIYSYLVNNPRKNINRIKSNISTANINCNKI